jgi:hypothetical protein
VPRLGASKHADAPPTPPSLRLSPADRERAPSRAAHLRSQATASARGLGGAARALARPAGLCGAALPGDSVRSPRGQSASHDPSGLLRRSIPACGLAASSLRSSEYGQYACGARSSGAALGDGLLRLATAGGHGMRSCPRAPTGEVTVCWRPVVTLLDSPAHVRTPRLPLARAFARSGAPPSASHRTRGRGGRRTQGVEPSADVSNAVMRKAQQGRCVRSAPRLMASGRGASRDDCTP